MNEWDFGLFRNDLMEAVKKVHKDKCSCVETYMDCEDKEYKIIIEEVKESKKKKDLEYRQEQGEFDEPFPEGG